MHHITLITDWQYKSYYSGALKGKILSRCDGLSIQITDITHGIGHYNYQEAALATQNACFQFPRGSVHVSTICKTIENPVPFIAVEYNSHFFISPDSGILNIVVNQNSHKAVKIKPPNDLIDSFPSLSYVPESIKSILSTGGIDELGEPENLRDLINIQPAIEQDKIIGEIIGIDTFGNIITNIKKVDFERIRGDKKFEILLKNKKYSINSINFGYTASETELIALFNSTGYLEIAQMYYPAYKSLGLRTGDKIRIKFS